jgi:beta-lactamase class A
LKILAYVLSETWAGKCPKEKWMASDADWTGVAEIIARAERNGSVIGAVVIAPSGERFGHHADRRFVAASTVKIPIMIELFRQIDSGQHSLVDRYHLRSEDRAPGSGVMLHLHDGMEFTLGDLIYLMIAISDNTATNVLIDVVGMEQVNATMSRLGMKGSTLGRKMRGRPAVAGESENWATPNDYAGTIAALFSNQAASPAACAEMTAMLEKQQNDRRIARYLPRTDRPRWGSKTGSISGVVNDVGFIATEHGTAIISVFCEQQADPHLGEQIIGDISRAALQAMG